MVKRSMIFILLLLFSSSGCQKGRPVSYMASTSDWQFIYEEFTEEKDDTYILHERMVARYIGPEDTLPSESLNIVFKSNYTEMWFSEDINLTETDERVFELSGSITIQTPPDKPHVNASIVTSSTIETLRLLEVDK